MGWSNAWNDDDFAARAIAEARTRADAAIADAEALRAGTVALQGTLNEAQAIHDAIWDAIGGVREGESLVDAVRRVARGAAPHPFAEALRGLTFDEWMALNAAGWLMRWTAPSVQWITPGGAPLDPVIWRETLRREAARLLGRRYVPGAGSDGAESEEARMGDGMLHANECVTSTGAGDALAKPVRVEVGQRWQFDARDIDGKTPDYTVEATTESEARLIGERWRVRYARTGEMLTSLRWSFIGPAPAPQDPKREPSEAAASAPPAPSEPTARDAVAGMLPRCGFDGMAWDLCRGVEPQEILATMRRGPALDARVPKAGPCIAALEALDRGDLREPAEMRAELDAAEKSIAWRSAQLDHANIARDELRRERDEARAEAAAAKRECNEEREYSARLKEDRDAIRDEAIDLRAEAAALREQLERDAGRDAALLSALTRELEKVKPGEDSEAGRVHILHNADGSVRLAMPLDADPRAALATVAELLGLPSDAAESDDAQTLTSSDGAVTLTLRHGIVAPDALDAAAALLGLPDGGAQRAEDVARYKTIGVKMYDDGIREGERRAAVQIPDLMRRTHSDGVVEGERRGKAKAAALLAEWQNDKRDYESGAAEERRRLKAGKQSRFMLGFMTGSGSQLTVRAADIRAAFGLQNGQPPTGGETCRCGPPPGMAEVIDPCPKCGRPLPTGEEPAPQETAREVARLDIETHGPLDSVLSEASRRVAAWPEHLRSDDVKRRRREFDRRLARLGIETAPPKPPAAALADADERWQPGAMWEHMAGSLPHVATFTLQRVDANGDVEFLDVDGRSCWSTRDDMTGGAGCGWRYVGRPASEARAAEHPAVRAAERAPVVPGQPSPEERAAVEAGKAGPFIPHERVMAGVVERAHADGVVEGLRRAESIALASGLRGDVFMERLSDAVRAAEAEGPAHVGRAALLALAEEWETEANELDAKSPGCFAVGDGPTGHSQAGEARALRCAAVTLKSLLDAPRGPGGGEREPGEQRPAVDLAAVESIADGFASADSKWHRMRDELKRRHPGARKAVTPEQRETAQEPIKVSVWRPTFSEPHGSQRLCGVAGVPMSHDDAMRIVRDFVDAVGAESAPTAPASEDAGEANRRRATEAAGAGDSVARESDATSTRVPRVGDMVVLRSADGEHPAVVIHVWNDGLVNLRDLFDLDEVESVKQGDRVGEWRFRD